MTELFLIGIGTGNPDHLTLQAIKALNAADLILIPRKGDEKAELAQIRRSICADVLTNTATRIVEFDLPQRDPATPDYVQRVEDWHDAIAAVWAKAIAAAPAPKGRVALLVWGDPSLYDSTLRIASRLRPQPNITVVPGITSLQGLTAAHAIPLNDLAAPFTVTTGRQLRDKGWPPGSDRIAVMLDGETSFQHIAAAGVTIWWGAYVGMPQQCILSGPLTDTAPAIVARRKALREAHGWIMDIYILQREPRLS
ncbi:precorrin-6A synthase (deacetylating) [Pseudorhodobacter sp. E13]|uniref:precorrin-6A synthase (deacetylating) n=1 Tax=Pseudorhodobacter sp. E13 TaxID=2487931 RepID=UPI000F8D5018|nr:precorrin-6A synthase (deacetylating) [Pseudorhodobacter sp. E13]RUS63306.1 precorrin-6A synthase (deacetylating) [Pseudorhodobacter sp. E13]